jgi:adenine-specific DNA-methyltransferase
MNLETLNSLYENKTSPGHRAKFGQYFTPPSVAEFMVKWVSDGAGTLFDPAVGTGAFQFAAMNLGLRVKLIGCEKDSLVREMFRSSLAGQNTTLAANDYFSMEARQFDSIVCNPPYLRFQNFENRQEIGAALGCIFNARFSGLLNASSAFLLRALSDLKPGGRLAFLMPLEFLAAGYGEKVKELLLINSSYLHFVRISGEKEVFPGVITSVGMVFLTKGFQEGGLVRFSDIGRPEELTQDLEALAFTSWSKDQLQPSKKWYSHFSSEVNSQSDRLVPLTEYGRFSRGIATGANEFFVRRPSESDRLQLPLVSRKFCITRSSQVKEKVFSIPDLEHLIELDEPVVLLDLCASDAPAVSTLIAEGEKAGYSTRYLTRQRKPWYKLETRKAPDILFGVFSRGNYKAIRNRAAIPTLTAFHGFSPKKGKEKFVDLIWLFLSSEAGKVALAREKRLYGGKLDKFEPNDLNKVLLPSPHCFCSLDEHDVAESVRNLESGGVVSASLEAQFKALLEGVNDLPEA